MPSRPPKQTPPDLREGLIALLIVPIVVALLLWSLWPSSADRAHWREITADLRTEQ